MVWAMVLPNGILAYEVMEGKQNSDTYIKILKEKAFKIIKLNFKEKMIFQQDNCPIHTSRKTKQFIQDSGYDILEWPPYSPDLNIIENIWYLLSQSVYTGFHIKSLTELKVRIKAAVEDFNVNRYDCVQNLYKSITSRLISVICKGGNRIMY